MAPNYPIDMALATPEYILELLRRVVDENDKFTIINADDALTEFVAVVDDLAWPTVKWINRFINVLLPNRIPQAEWAKEFPSLRGKSVGDLCQFLARRIERPVIRPWPHLNGECLPAGAFLTIRSLLAKDGKGVGEITPGKPLESYLSRLQASDISMMLTRLAPTRFPYVRRLYRAWWQWLPAYLLIIPIGALFFLIALGAGILGITPGDFDRLSVFALAAGALAASFAAAVAFRFLTAPIGAEIEGMRTFRDLSYHLAGQPLCRGGAE